MNQEIKQKWCEQLRSGEYKQGQKYLRKMNNEYCCLGVLCDIIQPDWIQDTIRNCYNINGSVCLLPSTVSRKAGLSGGNVDYLVDLNDNKKFDFHRIADWIERNL